MTISHQTDITHDTARKFLLPPPFTPQEFWQKIVQLLTETKGYVRHKDFEKVFGVKMYYWPQKNDSQSFSVTPEFEWYFLTNIMETTAEFKGLKGFFEGGVSSSLEMQWPLDAFGNWKQGDCVIAGYAIQALLDAGWTMKYKRMGDHTDAELMGDQLILGNGTLYIKHYLHYLKSFGVDDDATCITEISVGGRP